MHRSRCFLQTPLERTQLSSPARTLGRSRVCVPLHQRGERPLEPRTRKLSSGLPGGMPPQDYADSENNEAGLRPRTPGNAHAAVCRPPSSLLRTPGNTAPHRFRSVCPPEHTLETGRTANLTEEVPLQVEFGEGWLKKHSLYFLFKNVSSNLLKINMRCLPNFLNSNKDLFYKLTRGVALHS